MNFQRSSRPLRLLVCRNHNTETNSTPCGTTFSSRVARRMVLHSWDTWTTSGTFLESESLPFTGLESFFACPIVFPRAVTVGLPQHTLYDAGSKLCLTDGCTVRAFASIFVCADYETMRISSPSDGHVETYRRTDSHACGEQEYGMPLKWSIADHFQHPMSLLSTSQNLLRGQHPCDWVRRSSGDSHPPQKVEARPGGGRSQVRLWSYCGRTHFWRRWCRAFKTKTTESTRLW